MRIIVAATLLAALPAAAQAASFRLAYTTQVDATSGPAVSFDATLTTDDGQFYGPDSYAVQSIVGTRGGQTVSFDPNLLFNDRLYFPATTSTGGYLDSFGLDFLVDGQTFNLRKQSANDPFYRENDDPAGVGTDRLIAIRDLTLERLDGQAPVPEPATWATMLAGFGLVGGALRRRRTLAPA